MKIIAKLLTFGILAAVACGCRSGRTADESGFEAPLKKIVFALPFPTDLIYQAAPDAKVIVGTKELEPAIYKMNGGVIETPTFEISGFDVETGRKLWQLPFVGEVVDQTETQILVYEEKTLTVHFVTPRTGEITRTERPAQILCRVTTV